MRQGKEMNTKFVIFVAISALLVPAIYSSLPTFQVFVEGKIVGGVSCSPQGGGKTYCCASVSDKGDYGDVTTTYCTTCDDTNPLATAQNAKNPCL